ncbi:UNKNOWN [Stylonychia lemnae]|uniref:Uncharacterized protein n=1 Tax=Stylonychia lemnae TaxID=5949 RepID=A0A078A8S8_STYLE|nr:UNKNOWN [Stylonychia lemnae]|eukprot:CDW78675.1 UNKNOWN [Stylonychia lemnae]
MSSQICDPKNEKELICLHRKSIALRHSHQTSTMLLRVQIMLKKYQNKKQQQREITTLSSKIAFQTLQICYQDIMEIICKSIVAVDQVLSHKSHSKKLFQTILLPREVVERGKQ